MKYKKIIIEKYKSIITFFVKPNFQRQKKSLKDHKN